MTVVEALMIIQAIPEKIWNQLSDTENEAMEVLYECAEKQIPKKPSADSYGERGTGYIVPMCPTCQESVEEGEHHCKCGQSLDWSEV